jgi:DNA-damage-inducible protein J
MFIQWKKFFKISPEKILGCMLFVCTSCLKYDIMYILNDKKGVLNMAQTTINIRMDEDLKKQFESFCSAVGMNMSTAFNVFAKTAVRQQKIPFEISALENDPFFSEANKEQLRKSIAQIKDGQVIVKSMEELEAME